MFKQDADGFPGDVQKYGCYFFCLLKICEIESGKEFTKDQINAIYTKSKTNKYIAAQCSCVSPDNICLIAMMELGSNSGVYQVGGVNQEGAFTFWGWANKAPYNTPEYFCMAFQTYSKIGTHYVLGNMKKEILFDPSSHDYTDRPLLGGLLHKVIRR